MSPMTEYQIDFDPVHSVIRLTMPEEIVSMELAEEIYTRLSRITASGGPYACICDLTRLKGTTIPYDMIRSYAHRPPSVPTGRPHVLVGESPAIYGLARVFQMSREHVFGLVNVVRTLEEAYKLVGARPEDFTQRL